MPDLPPDRKHPTRTHVVCWVCVANKFRSVCGLGVSVSHVLRYAAMHALVSQTLWRQAIDAPPEVDQAAQLGGSTAEAGSGLK